MKRLRFERTKRGWSQQECAVQAGMHSTEISRIERGYARPWPKQAERLSKVFGMPIDELLRDVNVETREAEIFNHFKVEYGTELVALEILQSKSDLTYERLYELSQDKHAISLLSSLMFTGILEQLEEFSELYTHR
tara:strand:- start:93 stop:500 length:408 start_codon:yes stop_codon:yes gene_type:complete